MESRSTETVAPEAMVGSPIRILSPGCEVGDRYEVRSVLGMGGSGVVYAVFDRELRRNVALKVLRSDRMTESALKRFRREVAVARDAQSPNLVRVFDMAQSAESIYLTMELVDGESLARRLERGPLPIDDAIDVARQILAALEALHAISIVHRDIKPSNVMITTDGAVKLTDFGLARRVDSETRATETEAVVGTYEYLSPEQALGDDIDARSDLYSFGILLFECLTGEVPLRSTSSLGTAPAHISKPIPDIRARRKDVPRWLGGIIGRLLNKKRAERYQSAADVLRDLARRRAPRRTLPAAFRWVVLGGVIAVASGVAIYRHLDGSRFAQLAYDGKSGARAMNRRGEVLWSNRFLHPDGRATTVTMADGSRRIIAIESDPDLLDPAGMHRLSIIDPQTGVTQRRVDVPNQFEPFPEFSKTFGACRMTATDIDHDGANEVVISYCHQPYWPSYSLVFDPNRQAAAPVLIAAGHHRLAGTIDIDGDGRDELIFWGPSNRLGWYTGFAAVRVDLEHWSMEHAFASTPDAVYQGTTGRALLWYALIGTGGFDVGVVPRIDAQHRRIVIEHADGSRSFLGFDGFEPGSSTRSAQDRNAARTRAYEALRDAVRLSKAGYHNEAVRRADDAIAGADWAQDVPLGVWARRVRVRVLIEIGRGAEVEPLLRDVMARFDSPADACWEAATAFHLRGDLDSAVRWYREGLRILSESHRGRANFEHIEGLVFALAEMKQWNEVREIMDTYGRAFPAEIDRLRSYRAWLVWRATNHFDESIDARPGAIDFGRYVALEQEAARAGADPKALIAKIDAEANRMSGIYPPALMSLKAVLLAKAGRRSEALELAARAASRAKEISWFEGATRAHRAVIEERLEALRKGV